MGMAEVNKLFSFCLFGLFVSLACLCCLSLIVVFGCFVDVCCFACVPRFPGFKDVFSWLAA